MARRLRLVATMAVVGLVGSLLVAPLEAGAAPADYTITLGSGKLFRLAAPAPALGTRFYSPSLRVHKGDTIKFKGSAALAPANVRIKKWIGSHTRGVGKKWSIALRDKDEPKQHLKLNNRVVLNAQQGCGYGAKPCGYDGSHVVANGVFFGRSKVRCQDQRRCRRRVLGTEPYPATRPHAHRGGRQGCDRHQAERDR